MTVLNKISWYSLRVFAHSQSCPGSGCDFLLQALSFKTFYKIKSRGFWWSQGQLLLQIFQSLDHYLLFNDYRKIEPILNKHFGHADV